MTCFSQLVFKPFSFFCLFVFGVPVFFFRRRLRAAPIQSWEMEAFRCLPATSFSQCDVTSRFLLFPSQLWIGAARRRRRKKKMDYQLWIGAARRRRPENELTKSCHTPIYLLMQLQCRFTNLKFIIYK